MSEETMTICERCEAVVAVGGDGSTVAAALANHEHYCRAKPCDHCAEAVQVVQRLDRGQGVDILFVASELGGTPLQWHKHLIAHERADLLARLVWNDEPMLPTDAPPESGEPGRRQRARKALGVEHVSAPAPKPEPEPEHEPEPDPEPEPEPDLSTIDADLADLRAALAIFERLRQHEAAVAVANAISGLELMARRAEAEAELADIERRRAELLELLGGAA